MKSFNLMAVFFATCLALDPDLAWSESDTSEQTFEPFNYIGFHGGNHNIESWPGAVNLGNEIIFEGTVGTDPRYVYGLHFGRQYKKYRYELEFQQGHINTHEISLNGLSQLIDQSGKFRTLTINAYRFRRFTEHVTGFVGAGIGWGDAKLPLMGFAGGCQCFPESEQSGFVWQVKIGLERQIGERSHLNLQFSQLFDIPGPQSAAQTPGVTYSAKDVGIWSIGFRRDFRRRYSSW